MASIQESLYAALTSDPTLVGLVGDRIYPGQVPDDEEPTPWLFYAVPESDPYDSLDDDDGQDVQSQVEFHALGDTYAEAKGVIDALQAVLDTFNGGAVGRAFWKGTSEETTEEGYHHAARFTVFWNPASVAPPPTPTLPGFTLHGFAFPVLV
jgi:hypothetical protein